MALAIEKSNLVALKAIQPPRLAHHLAEFCDRPATSKEEEPRSAYIQEWAKEKGFTYFKDKTGNISVTVPATKGQEHVPTTLLQGHIDMVFAPKGHDFAAQPMQLEEQTSPQGERLIAAKGTTAGFDNADGCAATMAYAEDPNAVHGPLYLLFTTDEEDDTTGANNFKAQEHGMTDVKHILSLDGNRHTRILKGAAGFQPINATMPLERETQEHSDGKEFDISLDGLPGGHSGLYVHDRRGSAFKVMRSLLDIIPEAHVVSLNGGTGRTAISKDATMRVWIPESQLQAKPDWLQEMQAEVAKLVELRHTDNKENPLQFRVSANEVERATATIARLTKQSSDKVKQLLAGMINGVTSFVDSDNIEDPMTSVTTGKIDIADNELTMLAAARSASNDDLGKLAEDCRKQLEACGCEVKVGSPDYGYEEPAESPFLQIVSEGSRRALCGQSVEVVREHGYLELAILRQQFSGASTAVIGANIYDEHFPGESTGVDSVGILYRQLDESMRVLVEKHQALAV